MSKATEKDGGKPAQVSTWYTGHWSDAERQKGDSSVADASHAVHDDAKVHSEAITHVGSKSVYTSSTKQMVVSRS